MFKVTFSELFALGLLRRLITAWQGKSPLYLAAGMPYDVAAGSAALEDKEARLL